ncbi:unnamed protein product, partial [Symbiodinium pilosum]
MDILGTDAEDGIEGGSQWLRGLRSRRLSQPAAEEEESPEMDALRERQQKLRQLKLELSGDGEEDAEDDEVADEEEEDEEEELEEDE